MEVLKRWEFLIALFALFACESIKNNHDVLLDYHWFHSESISPSSINYADDALNNYVQFGIHNKSDKPISFKVKNFIKGNVFATYENDTIFLALTGEQEEFTIMPSKKREIIAEVIRVSPSEAKDPREIIREIFENGLTLRLRNVEVRRGGDLLEIDPIIIPKSASYL